MQTMGSGNNADFFRYFNAHNSKLCCVVFVFLSSLYHLMLSVYYGENSCVGLLEDGRYQGSHIWQPYGCMLHNYSTRESRICMKYNQYWGSDNWLLFIGDAKIQELYLTLATHLGLNVKPHQLKARNVKYVDPGLNLTMEFVWKPGVDSSYVSFISQIIDSPNRPSLILLGSELPSSSLSSSYLTGSSKADFDQYTDNLSHVATCLKQMKKSSVLWMPQGAIDEAKFRRQLAEFQNSPNTSSGVPLSWLNNLAIAKLNFLSREQFRINAQGSVQIWQSSYLLTLYNPQDSPDGIKTGPRVLFYDTQILLNMYCNNLMNYPDGTCCSKSEHVSSVQVLLMIVFLVSVLVGFLLLISHWRPLTFSTQGSHNGGSNGLANVVDSTSIPATPVNQYSLLDLSFDFTTYSQSKLSPALIDKLAIKRSDFYPALFAWSKLCAIFLYVYVCDRTALFMKENKWFTLFNFFLPVAYFGCLGCFFTEETGATCFLHWEQSKELKGWVSIGLLIVYMTDAAQKVLAIQMLQQVLMSVLLFMCGYGHFYYFYVKGDLSLRRFLRVLLRYNLVTFFLCLLMSRSYQFYGIAPLLSYWFCVIYVCMIIPPHITAESCQANALHYVYMIAKFVLLFAIMSVLYLSEVFFEKLFILRPWRFLFVLPDDSVQQWWHRWRIDRYTAPAGMVFCFILQLFKHRLLMSDMHSASLFTKRLSIFCAFLSVCGISAYTVVVSQCISEDACVEVHSYISCIPIISFLMLRNLHGTLRSTASKFFSWFGQLWFELLVISSHCWLAADGNGVLVLFPRWPVFNVILCSILFTCAAHEVKTTTKQLVRVLVPSEPRIILRNLILLICFAVPAGFYFEIF